MLQAGRNKSAGPFARHPDYLQYETVNMLLKNILLLIQYSIKDLAATQHEN